MKKFLLLIIILSLQVQANPETEKLTEIFGFSVETENKYQAWQVDVQTARQKGYLEDPNQPTIVLNRRALLIRFAGPDLDKVIKHQYDDEASMFKTKFSGTPVTIGHASAGIEMFEIFSQAPLPSYEIYSHDERLSGDALFGATLYDLDRGEFFDLYDSRKEFSYTDAPLSGKRLYAMALNAPAKVLSGAWRLGRKQRIVSQERDLPIILSGDIVSTTVPSITKTQGRSLRLNPKNSNEVVFHVVDQRTNYGLFSVGRMLGYKTRQDSFIRKFNN